MNDKEYFFRNDKYSLMEMMKRLPIEILSDDVIGEKNLTQGKAINLFLERYLEFPELVTKLNLCFNSHGRKGDLANIKIFDFKNFRYDLLNNDGGTIINNLVGKELNSIPLLSSFIEHDKCYLEDMKVSNTDYIDYKFRFEYELIKESDGELGKYFVDSFVECRHYLKEKIVAVIDSTAYELKSALGMISSLPYYININLGNSLVYKEPDYKQILLNSAQLESIKVLLGGTLRYTVLEMKGDKGVRMKIEGQDKDFEKNSITLRQNIKNGDNREVQFYWKDEENKNNKITIKSDCQIISTNYLSEQALKKIIDTILLVDSKQEFLIPIYKIVDQYCTASFRKALARRISQEKTDKVKNELKSLVTKIIEFNSLNFIPSELYCVISLNIIIQALVNRKRIDNTIANFTIKEYELYSILKVHINQNYGSHITEQEVLNSISCLMKCVEIAKQYESKLMDAYYSFL